MNIKSILIILLNIVFIAQAKIDYKSLGNTYFGFFNQQSEDQQKKVVYSPLWGAMALESGDIAYELEILRENDIRNTLIQTIFHLIPGDESVHVSKNNSEVIISLTPKLMGQLLKALEDNKWDDFLTNHKDEWLKNHKDKELPGADNKHFRENIKKIKIAYDNYCDSESKKQNAREFFSALMILRSNSLQDIKDYLVGIGIESIEPEEIDLATIPTSNHYAFELETIKRLMPKNPYNIELLSDYGQSYFGSPVCGEMALINFIGLLLYNPQSQKIDINYLTPAIQKTLNPKIIPLLNELFSLKNNNSEIVRQLILLFSNVEGVTYDGREKTVNFVPTLNSYTILLNHIFGTHAESFDEFIKSISNENLTLSLEKLTMGLNQETDKIVKITKNNSSISVFLTGYTKHGLIKIEEDNQKINFSEIRKLEELSKKVNSIKNILCLIDNDLLITLLSEYKNLIFEINFKLNSKNENVFIYLMNTFSSINYPLELIAKYFTEHKLEINTVIKQNPFLIVDWLNTIISDVEFCNLNENTLENFIYIFDLFIFKFKNSILINEKNLQKEPVIVSLVTLYSYIKNCGYSSDKIFILIKKIIEEFDIIFEIARMRMILGTKDELFKLLSKE